jgi:release factor glutamine methyltransferase
LSSTVKQWLQNAQGPQVTLAEARILLSHCLHKPREWLIAHDEDRLPEAVNIHASDLLHRRVQGEPIAYLLGYKEFYGRPFLVSPDVLIPRPETELLIDKVLQLMKGRQSCRVLDLGTGTGCIGITLALENPDWIVLATDVSNNSIELARNNASALKVSNVHFKQGSWWGPVTPDEQFDLIVSNPPYIENNDAHLFQGDLRFEPLHALTDEADGLSAYRRIVAGLVEHPSYLATDGWIVLEHGFNQALAIADIFRDSSAFETQSFNDLADHPRLITATRPTAR